MLASQHWHIELSIKIHTSATLLCKYFILPRPQCSWTNVRKEKPHAPYHSHCENWPESEASMMNLLSISTATDCSGERLCGTDRQAITASPSSLWSWCTNSCSNVVGIFFITSRNPNDSRPSASCLKAACLFSRASCKINQMFVGNLAGWNGIQDY